MSATPERDGARLDELEERLHARLVELGSVAVAFSGGVDSTVLLRAAVRALGARAVGVVADSPSLPRHELEAARAAAADMGAELVEVATDELEDPRYVRNAGDRCYFCKSALFRAMDVVTERRGIAYAAFGEITDDALDDRPGARAARERGVVAPLADCGLSKEDVRALARRWGLAAAEKPASACLASRIPVGRVVTREELGRVERAERSLAARFRVLRVRALGRRARVEVGSDELSGARESVDWIEQELRREGFDEVELAAYRSPAAAPVAASARREPEGARPRAASALEDR